MDLELEKKAKWAIEIAEHLPERYKDNAFRELFRLALQSSVPYDAPQTASSADPRSKLIEQILSKTPEAYKVAEKGNRDQQVVWAVIELNRRGEGAYNESIREAIKTYLGINPPNRQNTNRAIRNLLPKYLIREKREGGKGFKYEATTNSIKIFEGIG